MPHRPSGVTKARLVLAEGENVCVLLDELCHHLGRNDVQVLDFGGTSELEAFVAGLDFQPAFRGVEALAIVRDAESDSKLAWREVLRALGQRGLGRPLSIPDDADTWTAGQPRIGVHLMPGGGLAGMIETVCRSAVAHDPAAACVDAYVQCLESHGGRTLQNREKTWVQAYVASRIESEYMLFRKSVRQGVWPFEADGFSALRGFLSGL